MRLPLDKDDLKLFPDELQRRHRSGARVVLPPCNVPSTVPLSLICLAASFTVSERMEGRVATKKLGKRARKIAKKSQRATRRPVEPELLEAARAVKVLKKETGHFTVLTTPAVPCLPTNQATGIVFSCLGKAVALDQTLGQLYPNDNARAAFCKCVFTAARGAGVENPSVPCSKTTTVGAVIKAISC